MSEICGDTVGIKPRGFACFLPGGDLEGNAPIWSPLLFWPFPKCLRYSVSIAEKVSKELPIPFRLFSNVQEQGAFPNVSQHRFGHFLYISLKATCFCLLRYKKTRHNRKFKNCPRFFNNYDLP
jgi:hypothetical protein